MKWNSPFTIEAWVQLIEDYQVNSRILGDAGTDASDGYGLDISLSETETSLDDDLFEELSVLGVVAIHNHALAPAAVESRYQVEAVFETSAVTSLVGLALILFGLLPGGWRTPLKFRGGEAGLSRASLLPVGAAKLRKRSESELNSFSASYATIEAPAGPPPAGCGVRGWMR